MAVGGPRAKATISPSGEMAGSTSRPGSRVTWIVRPTVGGEEAGSRSDIQKRKAANSATPAAATTVRTDRLHRLAAPCASTARGPCSASANCPTGLKRSAGFLARARSRAAAIGPGTAERMLVIGRGGAERCWAVTLCSVGPVKGGEPASIS
jgi:hypothetical protein